jgi:probable DNA repair protein
MRLPCPGLFSWIDEGSTIVTPTPLLAGVAGEQFSKHQLASGIESWYRPPIVSIGAWLTARWQETRYGTSNVSTLLSPSQEHILWKRIIRETNPDLFDGNATARLASRAVRIMSEWLIPLEGEPWNYHEDARQFLEWHKRFRRECVEHGWITRADLWRLIPSWLADGTCSSETTLFVGFSRRSPAFARLAQALGMRARVESLEAALLADRIHMRSLPDASSELDHAARWARQTFERDPSLSIGIIIPALRDQPSIVERIFGHVFYSAAALPAQRGQSAFHINASIPLSDTPLVASALLLMELARNRIPLADAGAILRCPFITGAEAERSERAFADARLRSRRSLEVTLRDLEYASAGCALLGGIWPKVRRVVLQPAMVRDLSGWVQFIGNLLGAVGWPGDADLTGDEQDIFEAWQDALSNLAALGLVSGAVTLDEAIADLRQILGSTPQAGTLSSPVQIFDPLDAASISFDQALVTGLSDETWPPRANISPFIPLGLQRKHGVPGSGPEGLRAEAERVSASLFELAPILKGTYSGHLSPFVQNIEPYDASDFTVWAGKRPRQSYTPALLEQLEDSQGPAYHLDEVTLGGSAIIKSQSQCPFRAFAEHRLQARPLEEAALGFDARERGGFLHKALEIVWQQLGTQDRLRATASDELRSIVENAVWEAVRKDQSEPFRQITSSVERQRLRDLILEWLAIERARRIPFSVETVEEERYFEIPGLRLRLRVDRIDRLRNGSVVLIDYKSGMVSREKLKCPRPPEPQLLVYAAAGQETVEGMFFVELQSRNPRAVGAGRENHFDSRSVDVKGTQWDDYLGESQMEVARLADEFVRGYAAVDPISTACLYCSSRAICRVNERYAQEEPGE